MYLEIVSPEATLFNGEVDSVAVPGVNGEFQMLNNHAPVVSILGKGNVKVFTHTQTHLELDDLHASLIPSKEDQKVLTLAINSGTLEMKGNRVIILAD